MPGASEPRYSNDPLQERLRMSAAGIIRARLEEMLPDYLVPDRVIVLASLPRTANGKLAREALPLPDDRRISRADDYVAPRTATQLELVALWEEALLLAPIGIHDDFLMLGGNSLTALRLVARMRARFAHNIDLSMLFSGRTIADIAADLNATSSTAGSSLVPLTATSTNGTALYCLHAVGGSVLCYAPLAQLVRHGGSVIGVQSPGLFDMPSNCIHDMADGYAAGILADSGMRPCSLLGWSFGGLLAVEVATRLQGAGKPVAFVSLVDTDLGWTGHSLPMLQKNMMAYLARETGCEPIDVSASAPLDPMHLATSIAASPKYRRAIEAKDAYRIAVTATGNLEALSKYRPSARYHGRVTYFRATEDAERRDISAHWPALLGRKPEVIDIAADHFSILQAPHVNRLAQHLRDELLLSAALGWPGDKGSDRAGMRDAALAPGHAGGIGM